MRRFWPWSGAGNDSQDSRRPRGDACCQRGGVPGHGRASGERRWSETLPPPSAEGCSVGSPAALDVVLKPGRIRTTAAGYEGCVVEAAFWGFVGGGALLIGALVGLFVPVPIRVVGLVMGFGVGVLISAVAFELTGEAYDRAGTLPVVLGLSAGALTFYAGDRLVDKGVGSSARIRPVRMPAPAQRLPPPWSSVHSSMEFRSQPRSASASSGADRWGQQSSSPSSCPTSPSRSRRASG